MKTVFVVIVIILALIGLSFLAETLRQRLEG